MLINKRGSVLIISFWALIILMLMSFGITRRVNTGLSLARYQIGKVRSRYAAVAGLFYALDQVRMKQSAEGIVKADTAFACGIILNDDKSLQDIFSGHDLDGLTFDIVHGQDDEQFGLTDETGKINVNALTEQNYNIFENLLMNAGVPEGEARVIAASAVDWKDKNDMVFLEASGAEQEYYQNLSSPYACKNAAFETVEELLLVRGMTQEIFQKVRFYLTVYPSSGSLKVNFNTAPEAVLLALAQASTGAKTNTNIRDADDFVRVIVDFRNGIDGIWGTADDRAVTLGQMSLSGSRLAIASSLMSIQSQRATFLNARVIGEDQGRHIKTALEAVIKTDGLAVVSLSVQ